jgi:DNA-binding NarL/FixJ family response regulator
MRQAVTRVAIADEESTFVVGVRLTLLSAGFEVVAEAASLEALVEAVPTDAVDAVLLGEALVGAVKPRLSIPFDRYAVIVHEPTLASLLAAFAAGALGCIPRGISSSRLPFLVEDLAAGNVVAPPALLGPLLRPSIGELGGSDHGRRLTRRQAQILTLIEEGFPDAEVARLLGVSQVTVRRHLSDVSARNGASVRPRRTALPPLRVAPGT